MSDEKKIDSYEILTKCRTKRNWFAMPKEIFAFIPSKNQNGIIVFLGIPKCITSFSMIVFWNNIFQDESIAWCTKMIAKVWFIRKLPWIVTKMARQASEDGRVGSNICKSEETITMTEAKQMASHAHNTLSSMSYQNHMFSLMLLKKLNSCLLRLKMCNLRFASDVNTFPLLRRCAGK